MHYHASRKVCCFKTWLLTGLNSAGLNLKLANNYSISHPKPWAVLSMVESKYKNMMEHCILFFPLGNCSYSAKAKPVLFGSAKAPEANSSPPKDLCWPSHQAEGIQSATMSSAAGLRSGFGSSGKSSGFVTLEEKREGSPGTVTFTKVSKTYTASSPILKDRKLMVTMAGNNADVFDG